MESLPGGGKLQIAGRWHNVPAAQGGVDVSLDDLIESYRLFSAEEQPAVPLVLSYGLEPEPGKASEYRLSVRELDRAGDGYRIKGDILSQKTGKSHPVMGTFEQGQPFSLELDIDRVGFESVGDLS